MASIGHVAVGMAAARACRDGRPSTALRAGAPGLVAMAGWSALSLLPDADVIGFAMGVQYGDPWGHRGATHSLTLALGLGAAIGVAAPRLKLSRSRAWAIASIVLTSHALLDTMTDGGLGCALFWPVDLTRYFAPWRPIPVAPIGLAFLSPAGLFISLVEVVLFAPAFVYALRRSKGADARSAPTVSRRVRRLLIPVWAVLVWLIASTDPVRDATLGFVMREDTQYAPGFSEAAFRTIKPGQTDDDVVRALGAPLEQFWSYAPFGPAQLPATSCQVVFFAGGALAAEPGFPTCSPPGTHLGMTTTEVLQALGDPEFRCWGYSRSPNRRPFRVREVCFSKGQVAETFRRWAPPI